MDSITKAINDALETKGSSQRKTIKVGKMWLLRWLHKLFQCRRNTELVRYSRTSALQKLIKSLVHLFRNLRGQLLKFSTKFINISWSNTDRKMLVFYVQCLLFCCHSSQRSRQLSLPFNVWVPSVGTKAQITFNERNKWIQSNNKASSRTVLFCSFVSFVMTIPVE